jgi:glycerol-3-phosphate acyltransferase PlsY
MGKKFGLITLAGDVAKGAFGVWFARLCGASEVFIAAVAVVVVCGHCFSIPPYLKGGKGVATALGVIVAIKPMLASVALIAFGAVFALSKIVSLASMVAALLVPAVALTIGVSDSYAFALAVIGLTLVARHRANIQRLIDGQEPQFSFKKA